MKRSHFWPTLILFSLAALMLPQIADSRWAPAGCNPAPGPVGPSVESNGYRWVMPKKAEEHTIGLYKGKTQVGGYDRFRHLYRPLLDWNTGTYGEICDPPIAPPATERLAPWMVEGVVERELRGLEERFSINGQDVAQDTGESALIANGFPDDSDKSWLVVIGGTLDERKKIVADWEKEPDVAKLRDKTHVWSGDASHMHMIDHRAKQPIYHTAGNPTVYLLAPDGEVIHRQDGYAAGDFKALRKVNPEYDPKKDPDLRATKIGIPGLGAFPGWLWLAALGAGGLYLMHRFPPAKAA